MVYKLVMMYIYNPAACARHDVYHDYSVPTRHVSLDQMDNPDSTPFLSGLIELEIQTTQRYLKASESHR